MEVVFVYLLIGCIIGLLSGCRGVTASILMMTCWPLFLVLCCFFLTVGKAFDKVEELEDQDGR